MGRVVGAAEPSERYCVGPVWGTIGKMETQEGALTRPLRVLPGDRVDLSSIDPRSTPGLPERAGRDPKGWAAARLVELGTGLARRQEQLYAAARVTGDRRRILLILQAMDCGGKDGTVRRVAGMLNPQALRITAFGPPTGAERAEHFLDRIRRALPVAGQIGVFNRSHYEDVLIVRVHELVSESTWQRRYAVINAFERELVADGTTVLKVFLHISYAEQGKRLLARLDDPTKQWKFDPSDIDERRRWGAYQWAYTQVLERCSMPAAPWYVVPADRKWYRNWAVAELLAGALSELGLAYPAPTYDVTAERARLLTENDAKRGVHEQ